MNRAAGEERIWLRQYAQGVAPDIDPAVHASLVQLLESSFERFRERPAYAAMGMQLSYDDVDRLSQDLASYLQNVLGLNKGDRVGVMMPNLLQYPIAVFGVLRAGMVVVNINPQYTPRELEHQLRDSSARAIIILENFCAALQQVIAKAPLEAVITTQIGDLLDFPRSLIANFVVKRLRKMVPAWDIPGAIPFRTALVRGKAQPYHRLALAHDDLAFLQYTGGTTGLSKGAVLTHGNVVTNIGQLHAWVGGVLDEGGEVVVTALPLYHIFALTASCLLFVRIGGNNILIADPRDLQGLVKALAASRLSVFFGVNTLFNGLLHAPGFAAVDFSALKLSGGGGSAVQEAVARAWREVTGVALIQGYGLTETAGTVCLTPLDQPQWNGSVGVPLPSAEVCLRDEEGRGVAAGSPGELCVRGPQLMPGYWNQPQENAGCFTADGYFRTGDIAVMDERGYFRIIDRKKDMILVSGFNVYPNEVEGVAALHPGVLESACVGVPDDKTGEAVKLFVVRKDPLLSAEALREHCRQNLTGYKVPKLIQFRESLPKSAVGKILRRELR